MINILIEVGGYVLAMTFAIYVWVQFECWIKRLFREEPSDFEMENGE